MPENLTPQREEQIRNYLKEANAKAMHYWTYDDENEAIAELLAELARLREQVRIELQALVGWDLNDDPHGYANHYDEAVLAAASRLGIELNPPTL